MRRLGIGPRLQDFANKSAGSINAWFETITEKHNLQTKAGSLSTSELPVGQWVVYKNTVSGNVYLVVNDGGVLKQVALT